MKNDFNNITADNILKMEIPIKDLLANSLFYPACRFDGNVVRHFSKITNSFVYCDYKIRAEELLKQIHTFYGYDILAKRRIKSIIELMPKNVNIGKLPPKFNYKNHPKASYYDEFFAYWIVYERKAEFNNVHGPERFSLLYLGEEGVTTYHSLYWSNNTTAKLLAIIQPGHSFGNNYTNFSRKNQALEWVVSNNPAGKPEIIVYGGWSCGYTDLEWDNYEMCTTIKPYYFGNQYQNRKPKGMATIWKKY